MLMLLNMTTVFLLRTCNQCLTTALSAHQWLLTEILEALLNRGDHVDHVDDAGDADDGDGGDDGDDGDDDGDGGDDGDDGGDGGDVSVLTTKWVWFVGSFHVN